ncbi:hypothetical protein NKH41_27520 [Mesorhizobium sp. M1169]|uniref:hypothetical protein n=1 Tax=Mesorhizobium sp. M1169 TaxID=2957066 RepID=UPI0033381A58
MKDWIAWWSLVFSIVSFVIFAATMFVQIRGQWKAADISKPMVDGAASKAAKDATADITKLLGTIKGLVDSLSKASPSLMALISAIAFMTIAALTIGVVTTG